MYSDFGLSQSRLFPRGTLFITIAANIGETAILTYDSCFPDSVVGLIPNKKDIYIEFIMYNVELIKASLDHNASATAQKNINLKVLSKIVMSVPSFNEQAEILKRVKSLFAKADAIETRYESLKKMIDDLPQAILGKAFRGELV